MSWLDLSTACSEAAFAARPEHERQEMVRAIQSRRPMQAWVAVGMGLVYAFLGVATILWFLFALPDPDPSCFLALSLLIAAGVIWFVMTIVLMRHFVRRELDRHLRTPLCVWCGYDLSGRAADPAAGEQGMIQCSECGRKSPVAAGSDRVTA